jgi:hypothetical protein
VRLAGKVREGADIKPPFPLAHVWFQGQREALPPSRD